MDLKKSIFSYIVWAAFVPLCCLLLIFVLEKAGIGKMFGVPFAGIIGGACIYLLLTMVVFIALRTICAEIGRHIQNRKKAETVFSIVLPIAILVGVVAYLVFYLVYHTPLTLEDDSYYRQALVSGEGSISFAVHGVSWLYICLLHVMFFIFGNTPFAGVVLQIILFFICLLLLYIGMQAFTGTLSAAVSMALFGFLPVSIQYVFSLTPELFQLAFYMLGFALTGAVYKKFSQDGMSSGKVSEKISLIQYISLFLLGLYIGFLVYLDIYGISLYLFPAVLFSVDRDKVRQAVAAELLAVLGGVCGFFLSVTAICLIEKIPVAACLQDIFSLYFSEVSLEAGTSRFMMMPDVTPAGSVLLISLAFCIIPAFFLWKRSQCSAFILHLFLIYGLAAFSVLCLNPQMVITFGWCILAGLGVYGMVRQQDEYDEETAEKAGNDAENPGEDQDKEGISETDVPEKEAGKTAGRKVQRKKKEQEKPAPGEPLHNPLPVPKKKKRAAVDFDYQVKEEEMKFDIDVADNDDFDW